MQLARLTPQLDSAGSAFTATQTGFSSGFPECTPKTVGAGWSIHSGERLSACFPSDTGSAECWNFEPVKAAALVMKTWPASSKAGKPARLEYWVGSGSGTVPVTITVGGKVVWKGSVPLCDSSGCPVSGGKRAKTHSYQYKPPALPARTLCTPWRVQAAEPSASAGGSKTAASAKSCSTLTLSR